MEILDFLPVVSAVLLANAASFLFFMAAMKCSRLQKKGVGDDELPLWIYAGLLVPLILAGIGFYLLA